MFTQTDAEKIHETSLVILQDPGIKIEHDYIFNLFLKNGARQGNGTQVVQIPPEMVKDYLALCPKEFDLCGRNGRRHALSAGAPAAVWSCPAMHLYTDGGVRPFTSHDMAEVSRLVDKLDNIQGIFGTAMDDITPAARDVTGLNIMARNTSKHIRAFCFTPAGGRTMAEMKQVVGPEAWFSVGFTAHGPLRWTNLALDIYKETSGYKIPVTVNGEPMAGVSGPVTLAGSGAVGNAEILAGIIAIQLLEAGRPCIYNLGLAHIFDMRTMIAVTGGPENALLAGLSGLMGRFYGIPSGSWVSTESMCPDEQAAMEKMFGFFTHQQSGVSNIWGAGQLESELTLSLEQCVIDNEMLGYIKRYLRGVEVNDQTLAHDLIRETGISGSFLETMHTAENYQNEFFRPDLLFRRKRPDWESQGRTRIDERALEKARDLIAAPVDHGLSEDQLRELDGITRRFSGSFSK